MKNIYLNNAATSWPKPVCVQEAVREAVQNVPPGQYRSGTGGAGADVFEACRASLGKLLGIADTDRIFFTSGATQSMNLVLQGLGIPADRVITTVTEHNSVLRPLYNLPGIAGEPVLLPCDGRGVVDPEALEKVLSDERILAKAGVLVLCHCSNVTGAVQDAAAFGQIAKRHGLLFLLDVSQSAGCMEVDTVADQADGVIFTGHKSLMGVSGTGGFYLREGVPFVPAMYGGTGRESAKLIFGPGEAALEVGTQNVPGICALKAGVEWILKQGVETIRKKEASLRALAVELLSEIHGVTLYGADLKEAGPVLSLTVDSLPPDDLGYILSSSYGITTRSGLHCSPLIHEYLGSGKAGTLRISFSPFNREEDIIALADALREILR